MSKRELILSSTSPGRQALLSRLPIPYATYSPNIDETPEANESAQTLVKRLAISKAKVAADKFPNALIIGADQVGTLDNVLLNKPLTHETALEQLTLVSGKTVRFYTGLCLYDAKTKQAQESIEPFDVHFRQLSRDEIEGYLKLEEALNCAGSFHVEGLGIALIDKLAGDDYTALIGLPLIRLTEMLKQAGVDLLCEA